MRSLLCLVAVLVATLASGCAQGPSSRAGASGSSGIAPDGALITGTCWTGSLLGSDPQTVLKIASQHSVDYAVAATALADRPTFARPVSCDQDHAIEAFKVVRVPAVEDQLADYVALLQTQTPLFAQVRVAVEHSCMTDALAKAAARTGLRNAVMAPALPTGAMLGWAPASPDQWAKGQRVFACTLTWSAPAQLRYASVFTKEFPTGKRTCIDSRALVFVDCARRHDRERIAVIEARDAVEAREFPGAGAIRSGPTGRYVAVKPTRYADLDAACTTYLRAVSSTAKLTGIANIDADEWPAPGGSYPIYCEADTPTDQKSLVTEGSVYNRG